MARDLKSEDRRKVNRLFHKGQIDYFVKKKKKLFQPHYNYNYKGVVISSYHKIFLEIIFSEYYWEYIPGHI